MIKTVALADWTQGGGWLSRFRRPTRQFQETGFHFVCLKLQERNEFDSQWRHDLVPHGQRRHTFEYQTPSELVTFVTLTFDAKGSMMVGVGADAGPGAGAGAPQTGDGAGTDQVSRLAAEGRVALEALKKERPEWFAASIEYPVEDFSPPDLSDVTIDFGE